MDKLWAPWRMEYILSDKAEDQGCIFCDKCQPNEDDRRNLVLYRGEHAFILMNLYPYNNGHLMIAPYEHVDSLEKLPLETLTEVMALVQKTVGILRKTMRAEGFNMGVNQGKIAGAGIAEHLHFHIVPRWAGDTNFMPVTGHTKVMVQGLTETYDRLKKAFDEL
ncbi:MAG: HIT domain-containing protein [Candidatus Marinimicrobia bacterium]|nr:HIT domain-containing protein [Candidatus Neomarinimicrobiota bacterium]MCF7839423.1 HIT domain-containing protein [Candidatus Neomarinimicrobiota bacterium]